VAKPGRRFLVIAVALSVAVHVIAALLVVLLPRVLPKEAEPEAQGTVELLMVEQKGTQPSQAGQPKDAKPPQPPPPKAVPQKVQDAKAAKASPPATPAPPASDPAGEPAPPQTQPSTASSENAPEKPAEPAPEKEAEGQQMPPHPRNGPVFDLEGTDSESNAIVLGGQVVPAMKDDRFRNRPPIYPVEAEMNGEHGTVVLVIHVSENGTAAGADVLESSGHEVLDQAALTAVLKWHFRPAIKDGQGVPFDMPFRFVFEPY